MPCVANRCRSGRAPCPVPVVCGLVQPDQPPAPDERLLDMRPGPLRIVPVEPEPPWWQKRLDAIERKLWVVLLVTAGWPLLLVGCFALGRYGVTRGWW